MEGSYKEKPDETVQHRSHVRNRFRRHGFGADVRMFRFSRQLMSCVVTVKNLVGRTSIHRCGGQSSEAYTHTPWYKVFVYLVMPVAEPPFSCCQLWVLRTDHRLASTVISVLFVLCCCAAAYCTSRVTNPNEGFPSRIQYQVRTFLSR